MSGNLFVLVELIAFFGLAVGFCALQLRNVNRAMANRDADRDGA